MEITSTSLVAVGQSEMQTSTKTVASDKVDQQQQSLSVDLPKQPTAVETLPKLVDTVAEVNKKLLSMNQSIAFSVDEKTRTPVVKVIDKSTDEVVKQFPSEGSLQRMQSINDYLDMVKQSGSQAKDGLTGFLFNEII